MPVLSMFYGIIVAMYFADNRKHQRPHIHVKYQEFEAVFAIPEGDLLEGKLPKAKSRLIEAWVELHKEELMANWELAVASQALFKIDPLK